MERFGAIMPVIDETIHTQEIKRIRKEALELIERLDKRLAAVEDRLSKVK